MSQLRAGGSVAIAGLARDRLAAFTPGVHDMAAYLDRQVADETNREVLGPLLAASGASGCVIHADETVATWGDPDTPEMLFSATKSVVSVIAGLAFDDGRLDPERRVLDDVSLAGLLVGDARSITWGHLLQQTSMWQGTLWGKPTTADWQSRREGDEALGGPPGSGWAYNDVRVNLLCLALTELWQRPLGDVLDERVMRPLGGSQSWSWHGYGESHIRVDGRDVEVVSGGAHWGGGLFMSARDMALIGGALAHGGGSVLSAEWMSRCWSPCPVRPMYGYLWWLNDQRTVFPTAPESGRCARGNGGRHVLWIDPERELVIVSHWTEGIEQFIVGVSSQITS
jgi:CubicO group peptidase (beta-lactamase class C family)